jgi:hypothetical protein
MVWVELKNGFYRFDTASVKQKEKGSGIAAFPFGGRRQAVKTATPVERTYRNLVDT